MSVVERLWLKDFRNYREQAVTFDAGMNVLCGENAHGKTNLIEAVCTLADGRSPRAGKLGELVRFGEDWAHVTADIHCSDGPGADLRVGVSIPLAGRRKLFSGTRPGDGAEPALSPVTSMREWTGRLPVVLFSPEELQLVKGAAALRRKFLDAALCRLYPAYWQALARYNKLYAHKARILRDGDTQPGLFAALPDFNRALAEAGEVLTARRAGYIEELAPVAAGLHAEMSGGRETLTLSYKTDTPPGRLLEHLEARAAAERAARMCLVGPHRDDLLVALGDGPVRQYGSQGQARTAALSLKLAERELCRTVLGRTPVLLLDDVLSELDPNRRDFVLHRISGGQTLLTCCEEVAAAGKRFKVKDGTVREG